MQNIHLTPEDGDDDLYSGYDYRSIANVRKMSSYKSSLYALSWDKNPMIHTMKSPITNIALLGFTIGIGRRPRVSARDSDWVCPATAYAYNSK